MMLDQDQVFSPPGSRPLLMCRYLLLFPHLVLAHRDMLENSLPHSATSKEMAGRLEARVNSPNSRSVLG